MQHTNTQGVRGYNDHQAETERLDFEAPQAHYPRSDSLHPTVEDVSVDAREEANLPSGRTTRRIVPLIALNIIGAACALGAWEFVGVRHAPAALGVSAAAAAYVAPQPEVAPLAIAPASVANVSPSQAHRAGRTAMRSTAAPPAVAPAPAPAAAPAPAKISHKAADTAAASSALAAMDPSSNRVHAEEANLNTTEFAPSAGAAATDHVAAVIRSHSSQMRRVCFDPNASPLLVSANVTVDLTVTDGRVASVQSHGDNEEVARCIEEHVSQWTFPQWGTTRQVAIPFHFAKQ